MAIISTGQAGAPPPKRSWSRSAPGSWAVGRSPRLPTSHLVDLYDAANRTGAYYALYGIACDTKADIDGSYTLPSSWNDRISSFRGFGNCDPALPERSLHRQHLRTRIATDNVGATTNDQTSAVRVY